MVSAPSPKCLVRGGREDPAGGYSRVGGCWVRGLGGKVGVLAGLGGFWGSGGVCAVLPGAGYGWCEPHRVSRRLDWLGDNGVMGRLMMYSPEVRERAVRLVSEHRGEHRWEWAAICSIAEKFGCSSETLRKWVRRAETDQGLRPGLSSDQLAELKELRREVRELRRANEILG